MLRLWLRMPCFGAKVPVVVGCVCDCWLVVGNRCCSLLGCLTSCVFVCVCISSAVGRMDFLLFGGVAVVVEAKWHSLRQAD